MPRPIVGRTVHRRGAWVARVQLHREPRTPSGEYRSEQVPVLRAGAPVTARTPADRAYARRFAAALQQRYDDGTWTPAAPAGAPVAPPTPAVLTVGAWCRAWIARQTYAEAAKDAARLAAYLPRCTLDAAPLATVRPPDLAALLRELRALPSPKTKRPPAPRTVRNVYDVVRRALRAAVFEGLLAADPTTSLPSEVRPRAIDARPQDREGYRLGRADVEALLDASAGRWRVLWGLLALTGARLGEALALRWSDVREDRPLRRVSLARQVHHRTRELCATKTGEVRTVPEHPALRALLDSWWACWHEEYGRAPTSSDLIVPARGTPGRPWDAAHGPSGPLWAQVAHRALQRDLESAGLSAHRVHDLRHTFASLCADSGMRELVAARWTHRPGGSSARHLYAVPSWEAQCAEMVLLRVRVPVVPQGFRTDSRTAQR